MKIEMGKKYKTRSGQDVRIYAVDGVGDKKVHGAIFDGEGFYSNDWYENGMLNDFGEQGDFDLVEAKEDWEVLVEHFKKYETIVAVKNNHSTHMCTGINKTKNANIFKLKVVCDDSIVREVCMYRHEIELAKLEDCKKFILEK